MLKGYCLVVREYKAEICEFSTLTVMDMPDGIKKYYVHTKYGDDFFNEGDLYAVKDTFLEQQCRELNIALEKAKNIGKTQKGGRYGIVRSGNTKRE